MRAFIIGVLIGCLVVVPLAVYLYVRLGFLSLATNAKPLPMERYFAATALQSSVGAASGDKNPLAPTDENFLGGATVYREHCAICHGVPGQPKTDVAAGMFPPPP